MNAAVAIQAPRSRRIGRVGFRTFYLSDWLPASAALAVGRTRARGFLPSRGYAVVSRHFGASRAARRRVAAGQAG